MLVLCDFKSRQPSSWFSVTFGWVTTVWLTERGAVPPWLSVAIQFTQTSSCQRSQCCHHWHPLYVPCTPLVSSSDLISTCKLSNCWPGRAGQQAIHPSLVYDRSSTHPSPLSPSSWLYTAFISESKLLGLSSEFLRLLKPKLHRWHSVACVCMFVHACSASVPFVLAGSHVCLGNISILDWDVTGGLCFISQLAFSPGFHRLSQFDKNHVRDTRYKEWIGNLNQTVSTVCVCKWREKTIALRQHIEIDVPVRVVM